MSVLDVGCGPNGRSLEVFLPSDYRIVGIDLYDKHEIIINHPQFTYIQQDAQDLSLFRDDEFDLTVSIGMLEHICNREILEKIVTEIIRVSKQYIIIVPWKYAWIEPHFRIPFFQLMPKNLQRALTISLNLHNLGKKVRQDRAYIPKNYQWLSNMEWRRIFTGSKVCLSPTLETIAIVKSASVGYPKN
jgi:ubiquinone/menaquinone biosynthesis C-methylase UbiE